MAAALPRCAPRPQSQGFNQSAQNPGRSKRSNHVMRATVSERAFAKAALLSAIEGKQRGALATPEDKAEIEVWLLSCSRKAAQQQCNSHKCYYLTPYVAFLSETRALLT